MAEQKTAEQHKVGKVIQVIGPALDIEFDEGYLPPIYNAIRIVDNGELGKVPIDVIAEVANHIGESQVRCIAMKPTDVSTAIVAAKLGHTPGPPPLIFLAIPIGDMVVFATLVTLGVCYRKRGDYHKALDLYRTALTLDPEAKDEAKLRSKIAEVEKQTQR